MPVFLLFFRQSIIKKRTFRRPPRVPKNIETHDNGNGMRVYTPVISAGSSKSSVSLFVTAISAGSSDIAILDFIFRAYD
jgi:hypothetical protein